MESIPIIRALTRILASLAMCREANMLSEPRTRCNRDGYCHHRSLFRIMSIGERGGSDILLTVRCSGSSGGKVLHAMRDARLHSSGRRIERISQCLLRAPSLGRGSVCPSLDERMGCAVAADSHASFLRTTGSGTEHRPLHRSFAPHLRSLRPALDVPDRPRSAPCARPG